MILWKHAGLLMNFVTVTAFGKSERVKVNLKTGR